ncbi:MAG: hypothetical protein US42_C0004G0054 [Candidatus Magasanikbacteria bacterium GW2011_GWC2_37_14]|uniref:DUF4349 domain-containing protein n=1 Tax=Candidatus Magasanikbacteria bacterium GW2011_GWC2_37_14 TaxID=1619046 RepID=A0A0G0GP31_9BACT|nr:MAG: hypothetical protein US42_C0004G0054 [Candidatus Magasanikbacteria bacterium GW2011_GWC2_37_14]
MSKYWKIILAIALPVVVLLVVLFVFLNLNNRESTSNYGMMGGGYGVSSGLALNKEASVSDSFAVPQMMEISNSDERPATGGSTTVTDRLIIKTGSLSMVVNDVKETIVKISDYTKAKGGFVVSSETSKAGVAPYGEITVRIPAKIFDNGVIDIKQLGQVESESVSGQDVTEEFVDLDSQLKNLRAAEAQFLQIMQRATKIEDVLAVQRELTNVRGRIESIQGRMKYLQQSADLSTITVYLSTDPNVLPTVDDTNKWKPWAEVKTAARTLLVVAKGLANFVIWLVVYIPLWIVIGLVIWGVIKLIKKKQNL